MCIPFRSARNSYQVSSKLEFPGWAPCDPNGGDFARTLEASDLHLCVQLQTERSHSDTCRPVGHAGKKANVFLKIWAAVNPSQPLLPDTHNHSWVSFSHLNPESTGGRVLRLPSGVAAKKCPAQINTFTVPFSGGKKPWHVSSCLSLAQTVTNCWVTGVFPKV